MDPAQERVAKMERAIQKERSEFVEQLFEKKGDLNRRIEGFNEGNRDAAYKELADLINKFRVRVTRLEQSRLAKERLFFDSRSAQYKARMEQAKNCDQDTLDNLCKMALHVVKSANPDTLEEQFTGVAGGGRGMKDDVEFGDIASRVSKARAEQLLHEWKKILIEYEREGYDVDTIFQGSGDASDGLISAVSSELEGLKDKLFILTGEDQYDTFMAFDHYGLNMKLTDKDRTQI